MNVLVGMDLYGGKVVKFDPSTHSTKSRSFGTPQQVARRWLDLGAKHLFLMDLDAAIGTKRTNRAEAAAVNRLAFAHGADVTFGGGLRETRIIAEVLNGYGLARAVIGTRTIADMAWLTLVTRLFRDRIVVNIDMSRGRVAVGAVRESPGLEVEEFARRAKEWPVSTYCYAVPPQDGDGRAAEWRTVGRLVSTLKKPLLVGGEIRSADELSQLRKLNVAGVVLGSPLYHNLITLPEALAAAEGE